MKTTLYIDTSDSAQTTVGLKNNNQEFFLSENTNRQKSQNVLPLIMCLLKKHNTGLNDISGITVHTGPGSFTGLRVGTSVANTLGWALSIPVNGKRDSIAKPIYSKSKFDY